MLRTLSDHIYSVSMFNPWVQGYQDFNNFLYIGELCEIEFQTDELRQEQNQKKSDQLKFFRTVILRHRMKPIASGSIIFTQEEIKMDKYATAKWASN